MTFSEDEIEVSIDNLDPHKASGNDGINNRMLEGVSNMAILINRLFSEGDFPDPWKYTNVNPILKKGEKNHPHETIVL